MLVDDYWDRFRKTGRSLGLDAADIHEIDDRKLKGAADAGAALLRHVPDGAVAVALDERGKEMSSPDFAAMLARWRDDGRSDAVFLIGGADGHGADVRSRATLVLSFGNMVWPHMLARVMLTEQLYRASTILAGTPYHRD